MTALADSPTPLAAADSLALAAPESLVPGLSSLNSRRSMNDCWQRFQMGALMGSSVGACIGLIFGTLSVLKYDSMLLGPLMMTIGASFGLFMGIGAFIRCDEREMTQRRRLLLLPSPSASFLHRSSS